VTAALVISARDNVATALEPLDAGRAIGLAGVDLVVREAIPRGHKLALRAIRAGEAVVKYGSSIGTASVDIAAGSHVHTHNLASTRGRGDLAVAPESPARIAEPPDAVDVTTAGGRDR
jgi:altronate dehydratase